MVFEYGSVLRSHICAMDAEALNALMISWLTYNAQVRHPPPCSTHVAV